MNVLKRTTWAAAIVLVIAGFVLALHAQDLPTFDRAAIEKAVLARMAEIQNAAEALDCDKVFSYVLPNDKGALIQNGLFLLTRQDALDATKRGFENLQKVEYRFDQQHVTVISPTVALVTGAGSSSATTNDSQALSRQFAQSVVLVLTDGQWKVLHAHRSFPATP